MATGIPWNAHTLLVMVSMHRAFMQCIPSNMHTVLLPLVLFYYYFFFHFGEFFTSIRHDYFIDTGSVHRPIEITMRKSIILLWWWDDFFIINSMTIFRCRLLCNKNMANIFRNSYNDVFQWYIPLLLKTNLDNPVKALCPFPNIKVIWYWLWNQPFHWS